MLRLSKSTDYGLMAMQYVACHGSLGPVSVKQIAEEFSIPAELLAKILQRLAKRGLIASHNGPKGGYRLARQPEAMSAKSGAPVARASANTAAAFEARTASGPATTTGRFARAIRAARSAIVSGRGRATSGSRGPRACA